MKIARLLGQDGGLDTLASIRDALRCAWTGYDVEWFSGVRRVEPSTLHRIAFVHGTSAGTRATIGAVHSDFDLGDVAVLRPGATLTLEQPSSLVVFTLPEPVDSAVPVFLRPDHDPLLTDSPGGCATQTGAYRRVILTWLAANGPYTCRALNCHRVRMTDSFSHYHPLVGGFEELYLVHAVEDGARLIWSPNVERIEAPDTIDHAMARTLLIETTLAPGDLVFIPRGTMHRAIGGVLAHVVTIPGFVPAREIGVDHHLRAIDERLALVGDARLPYHEAASRSAMVK